MQDVWDAILHKIIRQLDNGNMYVVIPLAALPGEEESRKTVHRNDILQATQLADDMGLENSPVVSQDRSRENFVAVMYCWKQGQVMELKRQGGKKDQMAGRKMAISNLWCY